MNEKPGSIGIHPESHGNIAGRHTHITCHRETMIYFIADTCKLTKLINSTVISKLSVLVSIELSVSYVDTIKTSIRLKTYKLYVIYNNKNIGNIKNLLF